MDSKLQSYPKIRRSEPSPRVQDSAFPPFKTEHKYRGVYERAGFDIYKGGNNGPHSAGSGGFNGQYHHTNKSSGSTPHSRAESTFSAPASARVASPTFAQHHGSSPNLNRHHLNNKQPPHIMEYQSRAKSHDELQRASLTSPQAAPSFNPYATKTAKTSRTGGYNESRSPRKYSGSTAVPSVLPEEPSVVLNQYSHNAATTGSEFNFSPSPAYNKNLMGLSLDLKHQDSVEDDLSDDTANESTGHSPIFYDTNATSVRLSREMSHSASVATDELLETPEKRNRHVQLGAYKPAESTQFQPKRLSSALDEFKYDMAAHKSPTNEQNNGTYNDVPTPVIRVEAPRLSYSNDHNNPVNIPSQFESFQSSNNQGSNKLNLDYQNFLSGNGTVSDTRKSQLSMVSSIISRESRYSDEEDVEVQRELERQLEALKTGGSTDLLTSSAPTSAPASAPTSAPASAPTFDSAARKAYKADFPEDNEFEEPEQPLAQAAPAPKFDLTSGKVYPSDFPEDNEVEEPQKTLAQPYPALFPEDQESPDIQQEAVYLTQFPEEQQSQQTVGFNDSIHQIEISRQTPTNVPAFQVDPSTPSGLSSHYEDSIEPLSVRHSPTRGREFEFAEAHQTPTYGDHPITRNQEPGHTPSEVRINPREAPEFKYPSGSGPCRACKQKISPTAKGCKKAIYSKTGELTGQWHRECFKCMNKCCDIQFNKSVQCYVLDDEAYCHKHYHLLNGSTCEKCHLGIEGECIENELEQKWHLHCLKCFRCKNSITDDYYLINDLIFCEHDALDIISGQRSFSDVYGNHHNGLSSNDKIEKRRTRLMHIE
ncbi:hypothetical protein PSN45_004626 [Yamadazyma tenuis]|uniref:uncharacterized protein n=1 Tax=Candida tenuis TaxID=2315449 RepID=UPI0027A14040|nr:hypothetical protein PSN45_004626 [Yamadazyma tenuis]